VSYNPSIPQPTDIPANSQPQLLANFQAINTLVDVNHVAFDQPDQGKHKWVSFPDQLLAVPTTLNTEIALFSATNVDTGKIELNLVRQNNGDVIPFTATGGTVNGWTMLPSGILMKWGTSAVSGGVGSLNANAFGKLFTQLYFVMVSNGASTMDNTYVSGGAILTPTTFRIVCQQRNTTGVPLAANVKWIAIGV
jgi:hypothetical protein